METVVLVWWLVLGGASNAGSSWSPVPYTDKAVCEEAARQVKEAEYPILSAICISQPASDITKFGNQFYPPYYGGGKSYE